LAGIGTYKPIKIFKISNVQDENGDMLENTELLFTLWAEVESVGGSSTLQNGKTNLQDTKRFKVRFRPDMVLTTEWIIQYFGKVYEISNIERINEKRFNVLITATGTYNTLTTNNTVFPDGTPGGGGNGGTSADFPGLTYGDGVPAVPSGTYSRFQLNSSLYFQIICSHTYILRWPNAVNLQYPRSNLAASVYDFNVFGASYMDFYFTPNVDRFNFLMNGGQIATAPDNLPSTITDLSIVGGLTTSFVVPANVNKLQLAFNNLDLNAADEIMQHLVDNNVNNGTLAIRAQTSGLLNIMSLANYTTLTSRNWQIT
jgi:SPP1 family predicted phage head-tail adaptor